ncbi:hypothetical protein [Tardiphaga sp. 768_D3_N2_1]
MRGLRNRLGDGGESGLLVLDTGCDVTIADIIMPHDQASAISP